MKKYFGKRYYTLVILCVVSMFTFTACGSKEESEAVKETENVAVEEAIAEAVKEVVTVEAVETVAEEESVVETTVEEIVESTTEERPVYEGIDLESTLPIEEWIQTFDGIITEPKVIILNDETGRRQIVEAGDKIYINPETDYYVVYLPGDAKLENHYKGIRTSSSISGENYEIEYFDSEITWERGLQNAAIYVTFNDEEIEIPFKLKPMK